MVCFLPFARKKKKYIHTDSRPAISKKKKKSRSDPVPHHLHPDPIIFSGFDYRFVLCCGLCGLISFLFRSPRISGSSPSPPPQPPLNRRFEDFLSSHRPCLRTMNPRAGRRPLRARFRGSSPCRHLGQVWIRGQFGSNATKKRNKRKLIPDSGSSSVSQREDSPAFSAQFDGMHRLFLPEQLVSSLG